MALDEIYVKEGDRVHKNQVVARSKNTQSAADVAGRRPPSLRRSRFRRPKPASRPRRRHHHQQPPTIAIATSLLAPKTTWTATSRCTRKSWCQAGLRSEEGGLRIRAGQCARKRSSPGAGEVATHAICRAIDLRQRRVTQRRRSHAAGQRSGSLRCRRSAGWSRHRSARARRRDGVQGVQNSAGSTIMTSRTCR